MKRSERLKLVEELREHVEELGPIGFTRSANLEKQAADCIEQLENELDKIHENFLKDPEQ